MKRSLQTTAMPHHRPCPPCWNKASRARCRTALVSEDQICDSSSPYPGTPSRRSLGGCPGRYSLFWTPAGRDKHLWMCRNMKVLPLLPQQRRWRISPWENQLEGRNLSFHLKSTPISAHTSMVCIQFCRLDVAIVQESESIYREPTNWTYTPGYPSNEADKSKASWLPSLILISVSHSEASLSGNLPSAGEICF